MKLGYLKKTAIVLALTAASAASMADPQTEAGTLDVSALVTQSCTVATDPLAFGTYNDADGNDVDTGNIKVTCSLGAVVSMIELGNGANSDGNQRHLVTGAGGSNEKLAYSIYKPVGASLSTSAAAGTCDGTTAWGAGNTDGLAFSGVITTAAEQNITVCGHMASGQSAVSGNYTDTVAVTVTYS